MMNLLFLDSIEAETFGGMEEWIRLVAGGLVDRGHRVTVAGRPGSEFLRRTKDYHLGIYILPLKISGDFDPFMITAIRKHIAQREIEAVLVNFNKDIRLGGLAARLGLSAKVIWSAGLDITRDSLVHRLLTPRLLDGVIVPSASLKTQITRLGYIKPESVAVIPIGIPEAKRDWSREEARAELRQKYSLPPQSLVAVTSGRFVTQKGHKYLVEAAPQLCRQYPNLRFLFLGDGPLRAELEDQMVSLGVRENFLLAGMLDQFEMELAGADLLIHPSIEEPFGIVLLEAMRAGLPIVASRVGGIPEVVDEPDSALLIEPGDPEAIVTAALAVLADPKRLKQMGESGRHRYQGQFTVAVMTKMVEDYIKSIVEDCPCPSSKQ